MKDGWNYKIFTSCLVKVPRQVQVKSKDYKSSGKYPIVSQEAELISGYWDDEAIVYKHEAPVVIFGDHTKNIKYIDFDFVVGADGTHILSTTNDLNPKFFYYALRSIKLRNLGYARHFKLLKQQQIPVPSLTEQQSIVEYLDTSFAKIDAMKANAEKALNEAKALFQASLQSLLEPKDGWAEKMLGEILNLRRGHDLTHAEMVGDDYPVAGSNGPIGSHNCCTPISPCITIGRSGSVGAVNIYEKCWAHNTTLYIDDFKGNYPQYLYYLLFSMDLAHLNSGSAVPTLNRNFIHPLTVPFIEDNNRQKEVVETLDELKSNVAHLQSNYDQISKECDALKQALLKQVFE